MAKKLTLKCNGKKLTITPLAMERDLPAGNPMVVAPGHGEIEISTPDLSNEADYVGKPITCKVEVTGKNIAQISSEIMLRIGKTLVGPLYRDYLVSPTDREVKGIRHPRWTSENDIVFNVTPTIKLLYCGEGFTLACMRPENYGVVAEAQIWLLEGVYQRGGGEPFRARLEFNNQGDLIKKTGFYPASLDGLVSPFELFIEDGDTFEPYVTLISDKGEESLATVNPVMLGGCLPIWVKDDVPEGTYNVGVTVEDFDGKSTSRFSAVTIVKQ